MPKNKTHSGASKRFRVTGTGKIMHARVGMNKKLSPYKKNSAQKRRLTGLVMIAKADTARVKQMLGI